MSDLALKNHKQKKIYFLIIVIMFFLVSLVFSIRFSNAFVIPKRFFLRLFTGALATYWFWGFNRARLKPLKNPVFYSAFLFVAVTVISTVFSIFPQAGIDSTLDLICCFIVYSVIVSVMDIKDGQKLIPFFLICGAIVAVYSIIQHFGLDPVPWKQMSMVKNRSISTLGNPNFLSAYLSILIPLAFCELYRTKLKVVQGLMLALWGLFGFTVIFTYTRAGLIAMAAGVLFAALFVGKAEILKRKAVGIALIFLWILAFAGVGYLEKAGVSSNVLSEKVTQAVNATSKNVTARFFLWKTAALIAGERPLLGAGPGTLSITYLPYRYLEPVSIRYRIAMPESAHNIFLDILIFSGIFALAAFLSFTGLLVYHGVRFFRGKILPDEDEAEERDVRIVYAGFTGAMAAFYAHHMAVFSTLPTDLLFWILGGFCTIAFLKPDTVTAVEDKTDGRFGLVLKLLPVIAFGAFSFLLWMTYRNAVADYHFNMGNSLRYPIRAQNDPERKKIFIDMAIMHMNRAVYYNPREQNYWLGRGKILEECAVSAQKNEDMLKYGNHAIDSYRRAQGINPENPYPYADEARIYSTFGAYDKALETYETAISLDAYNPVIVTDFAFALDKAGRPGDAESYLKKAIEIYPVGNWTYGNLGVFYYQRGDYGQAQEFLEKALKIPSDPDDMEKSGPRLKRFEEYLNKIKRNEKDKLSVE